MLEQKGNTDFPELACNCQSQTGNWHIEVLASSKTVAQASKTETMQGQLRNDSETAEISCMMSDKRENLGDVTAFKDLTS